MAAGIFETLRVYSGAPYKLKEHLARLSASAIKLRLTVPRDLEKIVLDEIVNANVRGAGDRLLRISLSREDDGTTDRSALSVALEPLPSIRADWYSAGIRVRVATDRRNEFAVDAGLKTTALLASIREFRAAATPGLDDVIYLDTQGHVCEATASNVFFYFDGLLTTPPLTCGVLPGITRAAVLKMAATCGISSSDATAVDSGLLYSAAEIFLTSSIREIVPVVSVDGKPVGSGAPGLVTMTFMHDYERTARCKS